MRDAAASAGRELKEFGISWVFSVAGMPDDEKDVLLKSHYPTVAEVTRKREEHENATGHSLKGWETFLNYAPDDPGERWLGPPG